MIIHLLRMRRNVNLNVFNDRKNVSATPYWTGLLPTTIIKCLHKDRPHTCTVSFFDFVEAG